MATREACTERERTGEFGATSFTIANGTRSALGAAAAPAFSLSASSPSAAAAPPSIAVDVASCKTCSAF